MVHVNDFAPLVRITVSDKKAYGSDASVVILSKNGNAQEHSVGELDTHSNKVVDDTQLAC